MPPFAPVRSPGDRLTRIVMSLIGPGNLTRADRKALAAAVLKL